MAYQSGSPLPDASCGVGYRFVKGTGTKTVQYQEHNQSRDFLQSKSKADKQRFALKTSPTGDSKHITIPWHINILSIGQSRQTLPHIATGHSGIAKLGWIQDQPQDQAPQSHHHQPHSSAPIKP
nr:hypothetical protein Iba_chr15fCG2650 [Ipomoea batatas]